jgi:hypothetical protein
MYTVLSLRQIVELSDLHMVVIVILLALLDLPYATVCMFPSSFYVICTFSFWFYVMCMWGLSFDAKLRFQVSLFLFFLKFSYCVTLERRHWWRGGVYAVYTHWLLTMDNVPHRSWVGGVRKDAGECGGHGGFFISRHVAVVRHVHVLSRGSMGLIT